MIHDAAEMNVHSFLPSIFQVQVNHWVLWKCPSGWLKHHRHITEMAAALTCTNDVHSPSVFWLSSLFTFFF